MTKKNEVYLINELRPGCFKAEKIVEPEEKPPSHQNAPQPEPGIWFNHSNIRKFSKSYASIPIGCESRFDLSLNFSILNSFNDGFTVGFKFIFSDQTSIFSFI